MENHFTHPMPSAFDLANQIHKGNNSSQEIVQFYLDRIFEINPSLNAAILIADNLLSKAQAADRVPQDQRPFLHGIPISLKDAFDLRGYPTTSGTIGRMHRIAVDHAVVVQRLINAGAIISAKTNTPELCLAYETDNDLFGRTNNPHDPNLTCGGSSGGEAALIAAGASLLGIGSDAGGSIRIPAHFCGIAGFKPGAGCLPVEGHVPAYKGIWQQFSQPGPLARCAADLWLAFNIMNGSDLSRLHETGFEINTYLQDKALKTKRIVFFTDNGIISPDQDTQAILRSLVDKLVDRGFNIVEQRPPAIPYTQEVFLKLTQSDSGIGIIKTLAYEGTPLNKAHRFTHQLIESAKASPYAGTPRDELKADINKYQHDMHTYMQNTDIILSPVFPTPAVAHGDTFNDSIRPGFSYVSAYNLAGFPAAVIPVGSSKEGLPIGIQIAAGPMQEERVLKMAAWVEAAASFNQFAA